MGNIKDKHRKRKDRGNDPLSGDIGDRNRDTNDFDIDSDKISDQQNKK